MHIELVVIGGKVFLQGWQGLEGVIEGLARIDARPGSAVVVIVQFC